MLVRDGVSTVPASYVLTSLASFAVLYGVLAVIWFRLMRRYAAEGLPEVQAPELRTQDDERPLSFAY